MLPKNQERLLKYRRANRKMPRCKIKFSLDEISYKFPDTLKKFTTESGRILPRRVTGVPAKIHRKLTKEIKHARALNLLP